jgi:hypothetical protein
VVGQVGRCCQRGEDFWFQSAKVVTATTGARDLTLQTNAGVWICCCSFGQCAMDAFVIIVALNFITVVIDEGRVSTDYFASDASIFDDLVRVSRWSLEHGKAAMIEVVIERATL